VGEQLAVLEADLVGSAFEMNELPSALIEAVARAARCRLRGPRSVASGMCGGRDTEEKRAENA